MRWIYWVSVVRVRVIGRMVVGGWLGWGRDMVLDGEKAEVGIAFRSKWERGFLGMKAGVSMLGL